MRQGLFYSWTQVCKRRAVGLTAHCVQSTKLHSSSSPDSRHHWLFVSLLVLLLVQIIIAFDKRIWPAQLYDVVCTHCFVPELWMTQHDVIDGSSKHLHAVVGACSQAEVGEPVEPFGYHLSSIGHMMVHQSCHVSLRVH